MRFHLGDMDFSLSPDAFFQTCSEGAELLVSTVQSLLPTRIHHFVDLYAGAGIFSMLWSRLPIHRHSGASSVAPR